MRPSDATHGMVLMLYFRSPPPYPCFVEISGGRRQEFHARLSLVNCMCCPSSHLQLGFVSEYPPRGRTGQRLGTEQVAFVNECMDRVNRVCRLLKKGARQTLMNAETVLVEVMQSSSSLEVVPYCRTRTSAKVLWGSAVGSSAAGSARHELIADMVGFLDTLIPVDPRPFLCDDSCLAYADPAHLEKQKKRGNLGSPKCHHSLPLFAPVDEVHTLAKRWDNVDRHAVFQHRGLVLPSRMNYVIWFAYSNPTPCRSNSDTTLIVVAEIARNDLYVPAHGCCPMLPSG